MRKVILAAACLALFASQAQAANKMFINEYNSIGNASAATAQIANEPAVAVQTPVDFSGGAAQSAAFNANTSFIMIQCDSQCSYLVGTNPTATTNNMPLAAFLPLYIAVTPGQKISAIAHP